MQHRSYLFFICFFLFQGCAGLHTGRTFLTEMEQENDTGFFRPEEDFPVMSGDTGEMGMSEEERYRRTPRSFEDIAETRHRNALLDELRQLENEQEDVDAKFYERHKHKFSSVSDKIYFLELPPYERRDYLASRGLLIENKRAPASLSHSMMMRQNQDLVLGMSKDQVLVSWGQPSRVEIAGNPVYENERWLYQANGASKYIYFESGVVGGWE